MAISRKLNRGEVRCRGEFNNAYFRIEEIKIEETKVRFRLRAYVDAEARTYVEESNEHHMPHENQKWIWEKEFSLSQSELPASTKGDSLVNNIKSSVYEYLKLQSAWKDAVDC
jgi:hypothetical protein